MNKPRLPSRELEELAVLVDEQMGLHFPPDKWPRLERAVESAALLAGYPSPQELMGSILSGTAADRWFEPLASCLTVGETYFFRDPKSFAALEQQVLPELVLARVSGGPLRIWSAGCSDGAEPYSIAIACSRALPFYGAAEGTIFATDIARSALDRARTAVYTKWSLRDTPESVIRDYFITKDGPRFELKPGIRGKVTFAHHNLAGGQQTRLPETTNVDVLFCRNVLMYFSPRQLRIAADRLQDSLSEGGYLFVAPSEVAHQLFPRLELVRVAGAFCFRKPQPKKRTGGSPPKTPVLKRPGRTATPPGRVAVIEPTVPRARREREIAEQGDAPSLAAKVLAQAKAFADEGRPAEALALCDGIAGEMGTSAPYHFLRATILQEIDREDDAVRELHEVLYLDRDFALAHFVLGNIALRAGDEAAATKYWAILAGLLRALPAGSVLPGSDDTTAGELLALVPDALGGDDV